MKPLRTLNTMAGRIFIILLLGIALSALLALMISSANRVNDVRRVQAARSAERVESFYNRLDRSRGAERLHLARRGQHFVHPVDGPVATGRRDEGMTAQLRTLLPAGSRIAAYSVPVDQCTPPRREGDHRTAAEVAWRDAVQATDCWVVSGTLSDGTAFHVLTGTPPLFLKNALGSDPLFLALVGIAAALLALIVAHIAAQPLRSLARAATELGPDLDGPRLPETGPHDVRVAIQAFNAMQDRLRQHMREQTNMLAAISHDLQTPMTRLRLKLEQMDDSDMRDRLMSDWRSMRAIVDEGLALARSTGITEKAVLLNVDSLVESIVEDECDAGRDARFDYRAGRDLYCRPESLRRVVQNLVDNAIKYGGSVTLRTNADRRGVTIHISDDGPGIPEDRLEDVFEPMVRLEESRSRETGGSGLGLTIARILMRRSGGDVTLRNRLGGGLEATVTVPDLRGRK